MKDINEDAKDLCMICLEGCTSYIISLVCTCKIVSHEVCFQKWLEQCNICIICKKSLPNRNVIINEILSQSASMACFKRVVKIFLECFHHSSYIISSTQQTIHFFIKSIILGIIMSFTFILVIFPILLFLEVCLTFVKLKFILSELFSDTPKLPYNIYKI